MFLFSVPVGSVKPSEAQAISVGMLSAHDTETHDTR